MGSACSAMRPIRRRLRPTGPWLLAGTALGECRSAGQAGPVFPAPDTRGSRADGGFGPHGVSSGPAGPVFVDVAQPNTPHRTAVVKPETTTRGRRGRMPGLPRPRRGQLPRTAPKADPLVVGTAGKVQPLDALPVVRA